MTVKHFDFNWKKCSSDKFSVDVSLIQDNPINNYVETPIEYLV